jgi:LytS/YehU family sensor histidine kinase
MSALDAEVNYLRTWLAVERERWGDRLTIEWDVAADTLNAAVPPLILQPLVENALRHGISARMDGGTLRVISRLVPGPKELLELRVVDDGVGFPSVPEERTGLGNLRERLAAVYGEDASLTIDPVPRGAAVTIRLPVEERDARAGG